MEKISDVFQVLSTFLWGWPMIILLLGTHVFLTFRLRIPQRKLLTGIRLSVKKDPGAKGDVSQFGALATAWRPPSARVILWVWLRLWLWVVLVLFSGVG